MKFQTTVLVVPGSLGILIVAASCGVSDRHIQVDRDGTSAGTAGASGRSNNARAGAGGSSNTTAGTNSGNSTTGGLIISAGATGNISTAGSPSDSVASGGAEATTGGSSASVGGAASGGDATSGSTSAGGKPTGGGSSSGGRNAAGASTGGRGGAANGGAATAGRAAAAGSVAAGGAATGGAATGGAATGGAATGGAATGGAATGGAATGGAANWCDTQKAPTGVLAGDFQCVDFDLGLPSTSTWTRTQTNSGSLAVSTARASSAPNSLLTTTPSAANYTTAASATMTWKDVGSNPISSVSLVASLSPITLGGVVAPWTGDISLLCVEFGNGTACLSYTIGNSGMSFQTEAYTGYFIDAMYVGGAAVRFQCPVTGTLTANIWNRVELRVTRGASPPVRVLVGGSEVGTCSVGFDADTVAIVTVGQEVHAETTVGWTMYYDNVVATVTR